jgi:hypothetical protein
MSPDSRFIFVTKVLSCLNIEYDFQSFFIDKLKCLIFSEFDQLIFYECNPKSFWTLGFVIYRDSCTEANRTALRISF